ncbi:hypothetical protein Anapl_04110 [Anas platyrhynchos]|uniref:Uncharacterized protein n=1 Tax=Anas platyrhynchos TaxID=8839 RepID=R0LLJ2_ANAPL|nr:hypothetical protein Anapl_04110 [Anas platyrhynchos]
MDRGKHKLKLYAGPCQPERKRGARNASPGKEKPLRAGEHTVDNTRAFPRAQLSSDPLLSASLQKQHTPQVTAGSRQQKMPSSTEDEDGCCQPPCEPPETLLRTCP